MTSKKLCQLAILQKQMKGGTAASCTMLLLRAELVLFVIVQASFNLIG